jgi:hypothetical protein
MDSMKKTGLVVVLILLWIAFVLPFGLATWMGGTTHDFVGFLLNPVDGASYLAKMYEGWEGSWRFTLPYTAQPGDGAYLFLFYLFLGHLAYWLHIPLIWMFHLARTGGAVYFLWTLWRFNREIFRDQPENFQSANILTIFGSGVGWILVLMGFFPMDFWVAEAYPFLAMFSNPHFPIGLGLVLEAMLLVLTPEARLRAWRLVLIGLALAVILPFAEVVAVVIAGCWAAWDGWKNRTFDWLPAAALSSAGGLCLLYQYWATLTDPVLAGWNAQNVTPSPAVWELLAGFCPAIFFAWINILPAFSKNLKRKQQFLLVWLIAATILIYCPFPLQRRFLAGLYIPVAGLAILGIDSISKKWARWKKWGVIGTIAVSAPTNLFLILTLILGAATLSPALYLSKDESAGLQWIRQNTPHDAIILTSPEMGTFIPALTGRRVLYGHPFETVQAEQRKQEVLDLFQEMSLGKTSVEDLKDLKVAYIFYGPREQALTGNLSALMGVKSVFRSGAVNVLTTQ